MAEIIKKESIKVKNGNLDRLCKNHNTTIYGIAKDLNLNPDLLGKFNRGERTLKWKTWELINNHLQKINEGREHKL